MANPQKLKAQVKEIVPYGRQVYKVTLTVEKKMPRFKAGQFLHLTLDDFDPTTGYWPESRVFSIASSSDDRKEVTIVYSVKGTYTMKMEKELAEGKTVWLKAPYGEFIIPNHLNAGDKAVLIAGGTGVSPFIPFLEEGQGEYRIDLNYGLRHKDLMIFEGELQNALGKDNFVLNLFLEENADSLPVEGNLCVKQGMLSIPVILESLGDTDSNVFFISGPPAMIESFKKQLTDSGISEEKIIIDEWG